MWRKPEAFEAAALAAPTPLAAPCGSSPEPHLGEKNGHAEDEGHVSKLYPSYYQNNFHFQSDG